MLKVPQLSAGRSNNWVTYSLHRPRASFPVKICEVAVGTLQMDFLRDAHSSAMPSFSCSYIFLPIQTQGVREQRQAPISDPSICNAFVMVKIIKGTLFI